MSNYLKLKKMLYIVAIAAIAIVIGFIQIPWGFLKLDFSEVIILLAVLILGTKEAILAAVLRSLIRAMFTGFLDPITILGEILAILASLSIIMAYSLIKRVLNKNDKPFLYEVPVNGKSISIKEWVLTVSAITVSLTLILLIFNTLISTPMYYTYFTIYSMFGYLEQTGQSFLSYLWLNIGLYVPFNLVKGIAVSVIFLMIKPRIKYLQL